ncbi:type III pantothenate kinase [Sanyastnella coralliicola]|uniref:type III pantothenate kinase n=1 Tax=Sanyastnella coralliicola TaxID=3069118 RepID=UPI0027B9FABA|nr:type III pantothenate kinase [Longitalea sp. SCSIO 12813]
MNLVIDHGNTRVKLAFFDESNSLVDLMEISNEANLSIETVEESYSLDDIEHVFYAASGHFNEAFINELKAECNVLVFDAVTPLPIEVHYDSRATVGSDRLANVVMAAVASEGNALVVDMGTCVTYDILHENTFIGGAISPGLLMRTKAMNQMTARLPEVDIPEEVALIGDSTQKALQSGTLNGWIQEINAMTQAYEDELGPLFKVFTGGDVVHFDQGAKSPIFADPYWTLKGYHEILRFNAK